MFQVHCCGTKSSVLTILASFSKFGPLALENSTVDELKKNAGFKVLGIEKSEFWLLIKEHE